MLLGIKARVATFFARTKRAVANGDDLTAWTVVGLGLLMKNPVIGEAFACCVVVSTSLSITCVTVGSGFVSITCVAAGAIYGAAGLLKKENTGSFFAAVTLKTGVGRAIFILVLDTGLTVGLTLTLTLSATTT